MQMFLPAESLLTAISLAQKIPTKLVMRAESGWWSINTDTDLNLIRLPD